MDKKPKTFLNAEHPWPGLSAFQEADAAYFHGRDREIAEMVRIVRADVLTVLFGKSGIGKSSILRAGLFPALRKHNLYAVYIRVRYEPGFPPPEEQVRGAIQSQLAAAGVEFTPPAEADLPTLWEYFHHDATEFWDARNQWVTPVLVFDQFEELFSIGHQAAGHESSARELCEMLESLTSGKIPAAVRARMEADPDYADRFDFRKTPLKVILSLREDFLADLADLQLDWQLTISNRYRLLPLGGHQALEAVVNPGGDLIETAVARELVLAVSQSHSVRRIRRLAATEDPLANRQVEPALLSVFCRELNNQRLADNRERITAEQVSASTESILSRYFERAVDGIPEVLRDYLETHLVTAQGYRNRAPLDEALALDGVSREPVQQLVDQRLVRIEEDNGTLWIELTHDILTGVIQQSRQERRARRDYERRTRRWKRRIRNGICAAAAVYVFGLVTYLSYLVTDVPLLPEAAALRFPEPTPEEEESHATLMWMSEHAEYGRLEEWPEDLEMVKVVSKPLDEFNTYLAGVRANAQKIRGEWARLDLAREWETHLRAFPRVADLTTSFESDIIQFWPIRQYAQYLWAVSFLDMMDDRPEPGIARILHFMESLSRVAGGSRTLIVTMIMEALQTQNVKVLDVMLDTYRARYPAETFLPLVGGLQWLHDPWETLRRGWRGESILLANQLRQISAENVASLFILSGDDSPAAALLMAPARLLPSLVYKPNLSMNTHYRITERYLDWAEEYLDPARISGAADVLASAAGVAAAARSNALKPPDLQAIIRRSGNRWGRNILGAILFEIGVPSMETLLVKIRENQVIINQFKQRLRREFPEAPFRP